jgi:hypothetical protein
MSHIKVRTQAELDKALKERKPGQIIACMGKGSFEVRDSSSMRAYDSSSVWAFGSSSVWAYDSSSVWAYDYSSVRASKYVPVQKHGDGPKVSGGVLIEIPKIKTAEEWCEFHGVEIKRGTAILYMKTKHPAYIKEASA